MAKKEELKSFQELISEEKKKAHPEHTAWYGRKVGQAGEKERKPQKSSKPRPQAALSHAQASGRPSQGAPQARRAAPKQQAETQRAAGAKKAGSSEKKRQKSGQSGAQAKPVKRPHQLTSRENISYLPAVMEEPSQRKRRSARGVALLLSAIFLVGALGFLGYQFIRAEEIAVRGNEAVEASYIISLSGIISGTHIFNVDQRAAAAGIAQDPHVVLENIEYTFPNKITLVVHERKDTACFEFLGTYVITDSSGVILGHVEAKEQPQNLPVIRGINVTEFALGAKIRTDDTYKQHIMTILLESTERYQLTAQVREIDLTDTNSVTLSLVNGMKVIFGQADQMEEKLDWLHNILKELEAQGKSGGTIDLSSVEMPTYLPPDEPAASDPPPGSRDPEPDVP